ncbi:hypothetical protein L596_009632 [Steinernema carpocapsae]|uniref:Protein kinase domain-containing protein n=1 Tax=Steinernema carpocapsae TaxID=34508 RepID=A0A4U5PGF1_STECR|nr:hypothetical protein L596_009632 [Steinernema carpocapsae]
MTLSSTIVRSSTVLKRRISATPAAPVTEPVRKISRRCESNLRFIADVSPRTKKFQAPGHDSFLHQRFIADSVVGRGDFGKVVKAASRGSGSTSAVKIVKIQKLSIVEETLKEAHILKDLPKHQNVLGFLSAWVESCQLFVQTELCASNLLEFSKSKHFESEVVISYSILDLVTGVAHLHSNGILHVDLKPENVFVDSRGFLKIGDFGLALKIEDAFKAKEVDGDGRYAPVDLLNGHPTTKTDVFSLALMILELQTRIPIKKIREEDSAPFKATLDKLPGIFKPLVEPGLNEDPEERPETMDMRGIAKDIAESYGDRPAIEWKPVESEVSRAVSHFMTPMVESEPRSRLPVGRRLNVRRLDLCHF